MNYFQRKVKSTTICILHLQTELNITCGISKAIFNLIENSKDDNNNYFIAAFGGDGVERFQAIGINPIILDYDRKNLFHVPFIVYKIYKICKRYEIDIIHAHHRYFDVIAYSVSKILIIQSLITVHSIVRRGKLISYMSNTLIACSSSVKKHLIEYFKIDSNRIHVINNFVNLSEKNITIEKSRLIEKIKIPKDQIIISYFGRFDISEKGIDILIKAIENIQKIKPNVFLLLIGAGKDEGIIRSLLEKSTINWNILEPQLNIYDFYNLIDIFVLPSRVDPFPLVMLESGLMKKPFIGSNVDGISEYIQDGTNGLLFEQGDVAKLTDLILSLAENREKAKQLGERLFQKVIENNTSSNAIRLYQEVYQKLDQERH